MLLYRLEGDNIFQIRYFIEENNGKIAKLLTLINYFPIYDILELRTDSIRTLKSIQSIFNRSIEKSVGSNFYTNLFIKIVSFKSDQFIFC